MNIEVIKPAPKQLESLGVKKWPIWEKEAGSFDWYYDTKEICYFLEGEVEVETADGQKAVMGKGDLVTFPRGLRCRWHIKRKVRKHYSFE